MKTEILDRVLAAAVQFEVVQAPNVLARREQTDSEISGLLLP